MKKSIFLGLSFVTVIIVALSSCYYDVEEELYHTNNNSTGSCTDTTATYTTGTGRVKAIMDNYCSYTGCHDAVTGAGGYDLTTTDNLQNNIDIIVCSIQQTDFTNCSSAMPKNSPKLSACDITAITKWQTAGFPQ